ncbi:CBS domain-containing protein [Actinomadura coerulea]|uniref:CBS domain-containing protein n=1 Tax=Actinomadura coerulea TaxID=46159 RepID=UPI00341ADA0F
MDDLLESGGALAAVPPDATVADVQAAALDSGHLRILVRGPGTAWQVVHVRDTLTEPETAGIRGLPRPALLFPAGTPVYTVLSRMRESGNQLALVTQSGKVLGVVTITDVLRRLFPRSRPAPASPR